MCAVIHRAKPYQFFIIYALFAESSIDTFKEIFRLKLPLRISFNIEAQFPVSISLNIFLPKVQ